MIPKILHHIWLGGKPVKQPELRESFVVHNPLWTFMCWTDDNISRANVPDHIKEVVLNPLITFPARADLLRYALLFSYGGVYTDFDVYCQKPLDPLLDTGSFVSESYEGQMCSAVIGSVPNLSLFIELREAIYERITSLPAAHEKYLSKIYGVEFQSDYLKKCSTIFPASHFNPFSWNDLSGRNLQWPESYAIHLWHGMDPDGWTNKPL